MGMRNIKNIIIGFSIVLSACGTLEETPNRLVQTQFDFYCRSEACDVARNYLYDHKLVANEKEIWTIINIHILVRKLSKH